MRINRLLFLAAAAALVSAGCEVHEHYEGPAAVTGEVAVDAPQGAVIEGPGVAYVDVEPDPAQRVYVYDEGYPPGTYLYDNYYYYNGYRYPHDLFVNGYVQQNIRQHRFVSVDENRQAGRQIEQTQRTEFSQTHGVRAPRPAAQAAPRGPVAPALQMQPQAVRPNVERPEAPQREQTPVRPPETPRPDAQPRVQAPVRPPETPRPDVERPQNGAPAEQEHRAAGQQPVNRPPANDHINGERPATPAPSAVQRPNGEHPDNKPAPANQSHGPGPGEPKHEESK